MYDRTTLAFDIETTGHDPYINELLLEAWWDGNPDHPALVIDCSTVDPNEVVDDDDVSASELLAHNAGFEKRWAIKRGLMGGRYYCTMVADQTIMSGAKDLKYNIVACLQRRGIAIPVEMDKAIRDEFVGKKRSEFVIEDKHILYNVTDVLFLHELRQKQQVHINNLNMNFLIYQLRMPLITILAEAEMYGFVHDKERWLSLVNKRKIQAADLVEKLNKYLTDLGYDLLDLNPTLKEIYTKYSNRKEKARLRLEKVNSEIERLEAKNKTALKSYEKLVESRVKILAELADDTPLPVPTVNWGSPQQPLAIMKMLKIDPLPKAQDNKTYQMKEGVGKAARTNWFSDNTTHQHMEFMLLFDKFKQIEHNIKSFGESWLNQYTNPITGKVHTCFRQSGTRTGRFASGDADKGYFNLQQIPKEVTTFEDGTKLAEYRACFLTEPGRKIATLDYTGCEIICMISLSRDLELKRISELPDQHSYMGTKCWRAVFKDRYIRTGDPKWLELSETYTMGKGKERDKFKSSGVFPVIYGVKPNKVASIQGFAKHEAQIFIETIEAEMPNVVTFVKSKATFAINNGYVLHNERTYSRRWFKEVLDAQRGGYELSHKESGKVEAAARNSPIQGTNVDIIIEAMVTIWRWAKLFKVPVRLLGQVHDELIYDYPEEMEWIPEKLKLIMGMVAQRYLIPEIHMHADLATGYHWIK